ncbi:MAG: hypothetical protein LBH46_02125 [Rickettsiales bacterium]|jgi:hypothetical protein|nr:hypothetical protein [Rickettsiales bacterium]
MYSVSIKTSEELKKDDAYMKKLSQFHCRESLIADYKTRNITEYKITNDDYDRIYQTYKNTDNVISLIASTNTGEIVGIARLAIINSPTFADFVEREQMVFSKEYIDYIRKNIDIFANNNNNTIVELTDLYINKEHQGIGLCPFLLLHTFNYCIRNTTYKSIYVTTNPDKPTLHILKYYFNDIVYKIFENAEGLNDTPWVSERKFVRDYVIILIANILKNFNILREITLNKKQHKICYNI